MSNWTVSGNLLEAALWAVLASTLVVWAVRESGRRRLWGGLASALLMFSVSDIIESQTGAWWRPLWLLTMKAGCLAVFLYGAREYRNICQTECSPSGLTFPRSRPMPALQVRQIDHVTFVVHDLERSRAFYADLLGMAEVPRPGFQFPGLWFQAGSTQIHLILESQDSGPATVFIPEKCSISRTRHVAFEVASAVEAVRILGDQHVEIVAGPKARPDGPTQLYIFDPDRNLVELFSYGA
jgi:catechol 2,3-dioxygenase-like lactoylglutathione lyase family enzyme